jgi:hypothetical protein
MSALLRGARVFSNETENNASVKQEMTTNINVKLKGDNNNRTGGAGPPFHPPSSGPASYPSQGPIYPNIDAVNFTQPPLSPRGIIGEGNGTTNLDPSQYQYPVNRGPPMQMPQIQERAIDFIHLISL